MSTRRDFLRSAAALTGGAFAAGALPESIARAMAIDPAPNTTFRDAEHVVILMQENRSFDHCYGALRGVRGFRDPRAHVLPNGNPVWFQTDARGDTYAPFHLDISATNATWLGGLPHTWTDQVDARAGGRYDQWLIAKPKEQLPFTLGHYARADLPFYYALADAFTVCDQAFCSSLTGTTANRLFLWTGAIRRDAADVPRVLNSETYYDAEASWPTFPERLEDAGVSWRIYQNEISMDTGLHDEHAGWLGGFQDNAIEWFTQYGVRFARSRRVYLPRFIADAPRQITEKEQAVQAPTLSAKARKKLRDELAALRAAFEAAPRELAAYTDAAWSALSPRARSLHDRAFTTNAGDAAYRSLTELAYRDNGIKRNASVPAGDVLHQFREDVGSGRLPAVSWLVAPANFSDHPSAPWYGAWYVSEALDILTKNPDIWKKTVFILCYDENDGYFDHVPPFIAPHPERADTGKASAGIDTAVEWANVHGRDHAIGLGYRVPLVVVSPWSRGGCVNSEVFDHTSVIRFLETWLAAKGRPVRESNISEWRRLVCGDLTSTFRPYDGGQIALPAPLGRDATVRRISAAQFRDPPRGGAPLTQEAITRTHVGAAQEPGTRPACPLPYELVVNATQQNDRLELVMEARTATFGAAALGAPFNGYSYLPGMTCRAYAVRAGDVVRDAIPVPAAYRIRVDGPNGFMREFVAGARGGNGAAGSEMAIVVGYANGKSSSGSVEVRISNPSPDDETVTIRDESYGAPPRTVHVRAGGHETITIATASTHGWYDFSVHAGALAYRYAGRVETGAWSITDPAMGRS